jgi:hypothetical protein
LAPYAVLEPQSCDVLADRFFDESPAAGAAHRPSDLLGIGDSDETSAASLPRKTSGEVFSIDVRGSGQHFAGHCFGR